MIVFKDISFYLLKSPRGLYGGITVCVCMCVFNLVPESFIWKKYVQCYMIPEWFKV